MKLVGRDLITVFADIHPDSASSLAGWAQAIEKNHFKHHMELKKTFGSVDHVSPYTVFNISGNKYRLIALVDYQLLSVSVEGVLTHNEYDKGRWKKR